jgi:heterodisulfide reductase subunit B2
MTSMGLKQYESSTDAVLESLGVRHAPENGYGCCGYPLKNFNFKAYVLASARNLAMTEEHSQELLTLCNCCYGSLKHAAHVLKEDERLREEINLALGKEGLKYEGKAEPKHLLQVLHDDVGIETLRKNLKRTFKGLKIASHYGCHILRPASVIGFDNPFSPVKFDRLVEVTGAEAVHWTAKLDCCGSPVMGVNDELSMDLTEKKLRNARQAGADYLCVACPYCHMQFDKVQHFMMGRRNSNEGLPSILYPQLLGLCLGIDEKALGLDKNRMDSTGLDRYLS